MLIPVTVGCSGLLNATPKFEATTIRKLRDQGAIILGKTVPTEWANYRSPGQASGGWSAVGGQCMAHYHKDQDPSGSSSGSAVAAGMGLAAASLATEVSIIHAVPEYASVKVSQYTSDVGKYKLPSTEGSSCWTQANCWPDFKIWHLLH